MIIKFSYRNHCYKFSPSKATRWCHHINSQQLFSTRNSYITIIREFIFNLIFLICRAPVIKGNSGNVYFHSHNDSSDRRTVDTSDNSTINKTDQRSFDYSNRSSDNNSKIEHNNNNSRWEVKTDLSLGSLFK